LQALLALLCPPSIRKCRQISPLLLTLLLTMANVSIPGLDVVQSPQSRFRFLACARRIETGDWRTRSVKSQVLTHPYMSSDSADLQSISWFADEDLSAAY
jgi:hypothetical protein